MLQSHNFIILLIQLFKTDTFIYFFGMLLIDQENLPMGGSNKIQDPQEGGKGEEKGKERKKMKRGMKYLTI